MRGFSVWDVAVCWLVSSRFVYGARHTNNTVLSLFLDSNIDIFIFMVRAGPVLPRSLMTISSNETQCPRLKFGDYTLRDHRGMILKHQVIMKKRTRRIKLSTWITSYRPLTDIAPISDQRRMSFSVIENDIFITLVNISGFFATSLEVRV